jgi:hypothetical protein
MKCLNWKDEIRRRNWTDDTTGCVGAVARASRAIGGQYQIERRGPTGHHYCPTWTESDHFSVAHYVYRDGRWQFGRALGAWQSLADAKAAAEADNDQHRAIKKRGAS